MLSLAMSSTGADIVTRATLLEVSVRQVPSQEDLSDFLKS